MQQVLVQKRQDLAGKDGWSLDKDDDGPPEEDPLEQAGHEDAAAGAARVSMDARADGAGEGQPGEVEEDEAKAVIAKLVRQNALLQDKVERLQVRGRMR